MADLKIYDIFDISPLREYMLAHGRRSILKRRELFASQNELTTDIGLVISGGFSFSRPDYKGDNQILSLAFAGELIGAYISASHSSRADFDITALCTSEIAVVSIEELTDYMNRELGAAYILSFTKAIALGFMLRAIAYRCESTEERYRELLQRLPGIDNMVPMAAIASYLGITRETFARLRRKLNENSGKPAK